MPSLSSFCAVENPGKPFSTRKAVTPLRAGGGIDRCVDDQHVGDRAVGDPHLVAVQHVAVAAQARACSRMLITSEPAPGSLIASAPTCSPLTSRGR